MTNRERAKAIKWPIPFWKKDKKLFWLMMGWDITRALNEAEKRGMERALKICESWEKEAPLLTCASDQIRTEAAKGGER